MSFALHLALLTAKAKLGLSGLQFVSEYLAEGPMLSSQISSTDPPSGYTMPLLLTVRYRCNFGRLTQCVELSTLYMARSVIVRRC